MFKRIFWCQGVTSRKQFTLYLLAYSMMAILLIGVVRWGAAHWLQSSQQPTPNGSLAEVAQHVTQSMQHLNTIIKIRLASLFAITFIMTYLMAMQGIRRLRDIGQSLFLILIPIVGTFISAFIPLIFYLTIGCMKSADNDIEDIQEAY